ncbi:MAG: hypothetical protein JXR96_26965 [Deltaproteobacteria bacterium]|nr:hypothetical protein [Deltaproteobacteria bacterium]
MRERKLTGKALQDFVDDVLAHVPPLPPPPAPNMRSLADGRRLWLPERESHK